MNYLPPDASFAKNLKATDHAYISRYALGRDYHKVIRKKLSQLATIITEKSEAEGFRPFVDSAPVLEHALAEKAGIGWTGKHSLTLNKESGSWFFLGELFINLPLPVDKPIEEACGTCNACISICPTQAIVEPYVVDARKCISYLTIENDGPIPIEYRKAIGNRIYGCDDCQLICPWNKYATSTDEKDFFAREHMHGKSLLDFFAWDKDTFLEKTQGSPIRRIGFTKWKRNLTIAMGNAEDHDGRILQALQTQLDTFEAQTSDEEMLKEHLMWAIKQHTSGEAKGANRQTLRLARSVEKGTPKHA
jgi:epoxyqueuosine reductase